MSNTRTLAPFFAEYLDEAIRNREDKDFFLLVAGVRYGKTTNFTLGNPYKLAQYVVPVKQNGKMVRESLWIAVRESETAVVESLMEAITDSLFTPEIMALDKPPVTTHGNHPTIITIEHDLADGTVLRMNIECQGFNTPNSENRIRSRSYVGAILPEIQGIPKSVLKTVIERCGTWRPDTFKIIYPLDGKDVVISGAGELKLAFADINIPPRPHYVYDMFFDNPDIENSFAMIFYAPPVLLHKELAKIPSEKHDALLKKYPTSKYEKKKVVWLPNPEAYQVTQHWEREDEDGNKIPWTGYEYWYSKIRISTESEIKRLVLGIPESVGGEASVYPNFDKNSHVKEMDMNPKGIIYIGYDVGKNSGYSFHQLHGKHMHQFDELYFMTEDAISTRHQIENFLVPMIREKYGSYRCMVVIDPAGKFSSSLGESAESILKEYGVEMISLKKYKITNQNVEQRKKCLEYFIDKEEFTVDPSCTFTIKALSGGFCYQSNNAGIISNNVNKDNPYSHIAESIQYAAIVLYKKVMKGKKHGRKTRVWKLKSKR